MRIDDILKWLDSKNEKYQFLGEPEDIIDGFSSLEHYKKNTMTWIKEQERYNSMDKNMEISLAIVQDGVEATAKNKIIALESKEIFFGILEKFWGDDCKRNNIGTGTVISPQVILEDNVTIGSNCTIQGKVSIGAGTVIGNNVVIVNSVKIGKNCEIQSLSVIGEAGFGYYEDAAGNKTMVKHFGGVEIGDNVFIGSHVNIARGTIDNTVIGSGTKIAPSTHIGHNNQIGKNSTIICSNLFGSVEMGEQAYVVSSTIKNQCKVGNRALVGMGSTVTHDVGSGKVVVGSPAKVIREHR